MTITFEVKWGSKRFPIEMSAQQFQKLTVGDLKLKCQELTEIQPEYMKLLAHGAILKNDTEYVKHYKINEGSKIMLMGSKTHISPLNNQPKADAPIGTRLVWLKNLRESVLKPDIKRYEKQAEEHLNSSPSSKQTKELINYGNYIHEQLMHMMHQLDTMPEVNDQERIERKSNVKDTEALLDLVDHIKSRLNQASK